MAREGATYICRAGPGDTNLAVEIACTGGRSGPRYVVKTVTVICGEEAKADD
jgi:hypothetical protein